jgi:hypothetical protein
MDIPSDLIVEFHGGQTLSEISFQLVAAPLEVQDDFWQQPF